MRDGRKLFRRKIIWSLLLGTVGGTVCASPALALDDSRKAEGGANDLPAALRLSFALGSKGKLKQRKSLRSSTVGVDAPLKLSYAIGVGVGVGLGTGTGKGSALVVGAGGVGPGTEGAVGPSKGGGGRLRSARRPGAVDDQPDQPEAPIPFDPMPIAGAPRRPAAVERPATSPLFGKAGESELPDLSETWAIAPIRWSGDTNTSLVAFTGQGSNNLSNSNNVNLRANSFIATPYIALWSGLFGYAATGTQFTSANSPKIKTKSDMLNFGGTVDVFPVSRFPFSASINRSSSAARANSGGDSDVTTNTVVSARQTYRTEDGRDNYTGGFSRSLTGKGNDTSSVLSLQGGFSTAREFEYEHLLEGNHTFNVNAGMTTASADLSGQKSRLVNSTVSHAWKVHDDLSIANTLGASLNQMDLVQGNNLSSSDSRLFYGSTGVSWRPFEDIPLTLAGGGNFSLSQARAVGAENSLRNISGFMSGTYRFNKNLSFAGNASLAATSTDSLSSMTSNLGASTSYAGDPIQFEYFNYGWGFGGGINNSTSTRGGNSFTASASASHSLNRSFTITEDNILNLTANQSISQSSGRNVGQPNSGTAAIANSNSNSSTSLSTAFGAAWRAAYGTRLTGDVSANVADNMSTGIGGASHYQTMSLVGNGVYQLSSRATISADANLTWTGSNSANTGNSQALNGIIVNNNASQLSGGFGLSYGHRNPFSIQSLGYNARLMVVNSQLNQRLVGDTSQLAVNNASTSLQQSLDYRYGRLVFRLNSTFFDQGGKKNASLFGSVTREFDGFFDGRW